ncbi:MAG: cbb3-type cytochrome c oxidase subunit II [Bacteroidota bacterium]
MLNLHKEHKNLVLLALSGFVVLSFVIAVMPAYEMQDYQPLPTMQKMSTEVKNGLHIYINEGCVACHTQQVRSIEMDKVWGDRPSIPSDYYYSKKRLGLWKQSHSLLGSERTGPDLTNVGKRQPGLQWHLLHLYNPRIVVKESVMPPYPWLFDEIPENQVKENDVVVAIGKDFYDRDGWKIVAKTEALQLASYLQSLKQADMPGASPDFIPAKKIPSPATSDTVAQNLPDGKTLYAQTCAACHQNNGKGIPGAFPPLAGSAVVNDENPELLVQIILKGYDARSEYGQMPAFGEQLTDKEIAAIANHERTSWGNNAPELSEDDVKKIRAYTEAIE